MNVMPRSACSRRLSNCRLSRSCLSNAPNGSSMSRSLGLNPIARANANRRCGPPDNYRGYRAPQPGRCTNSSACVSILVRIPVHLAARSPAPGSCTRRDFSLTNPYGINDDKRPFGTGIVESAANFIVLARFLALSAPPSSPVSTTFLAPPSCRSRRSPLRTRCPSAFAAARCRLPTTLRRLP
jgi:hypothetical protein